ncbi:hypothetical protein HPB47_021362 [Ixodes persulcatus]|uniref:Uncharacterized protein n=1 Tax=Ixodes persulcatus TaxID=34615 RepID=A0AC60QF08_IXOPE|nr:hypothetical protein HPB47_021362 [Ixodes persulcatus]
MRWEFACSNAGAGRGALAATGAVLGATWKLAWGCSLAAISLAGPSRQASWLVVVRAASGSSPPGLCLARKRSGNLRAVECCSRGARVFPNKQGQGIRPLSALSPAACFVARAFSLRSYSFPSLGKQALNHGALAAERRPSGTGGGALKEGNLRSVLTLADLRGMLAACPGRRPSPHTRPTPPGSSRGPHAGNCHWVTPRGSMPGCPKNLAPGASFAIRARL